MSTFGRKLCGLRKACSLPLFERHFARRVFKRRKAVC